MPRFKVQKGDKAFEVEADGPKHAAAAVGNLEKKTAPKKKPVPVKPSALEVRLIQHMENIVAEFHASNAVTLDMAEQIKAKGDGVKEPHSWSFDIERGHDGFITRIVVNPIRLN